MTIALPLRRALLTSPRPAQYWNAGGRTGLNVALNSGHSGSVYNAGIRRRTRNGPVALTNVFARLPNWYWDGSSSTETATGNPILVRMSLEYPIGTALYQFTCNGSADMVIQSGGMIQTDPLAGLTLPASGEYYTHLFVSNTVSGTSYDAMPIGRTYLYYYGGGNGTVDKYAQSSSVTDQTGTMGGQSTTLDTAPANLYQPLAIAGTPVLAGAPPPNFAVFGDSIGFGFDEDNSQRTADTKWNAGPWERWIGGVGGYGYTNLSRSGAKAQTYSAIVSGGLTNIWNGTKDCFSHAIIELGRNDLNAGRNAAQIQSDIEKMAGFLARNGKRVWVSTITPFSASTDHYVTTANQTADTSADRVTFNNMVRANGIARASGFIDLADQFESARDSGKWRCDGGVAYASEVTSSGLHGKSIAYSTAATGLPTPSSLFA